MSNLTRLFFLLAASFLFILVRSDEEKPTIAADEANGSEAEVETEEGEGEFGQENGVYVLTDANFDAFLEGHPTTLVEFYAPWCGHCKQLAPEYEKAAQELAGTIPLAKVDATVEKKLAERFKIMGFPSVMLFKEGQTEPTNFDGEREAEGIVKWLKEKTDPNFKPAPEEVVALSRETFDEFVADKPVMLLEFYAPWCGHCKKLAPELEKAAKQLKEHDIPLAKVDATVEKKLAEEYGVQGYPTLKILRNGRRFDYNGPREAEGIVRHMLEQAEPAAKRLNSPHDKFMGSADVSVVGFFEAQTGPLYEAFVDAAERTRGDFACHFVADPGLAKQFKAEPGQITIFYPTVFSSKYEPKSRTFPKPEATSEELLAFFRDNSTPLVGQMTRMNSATRYARRPLVVVYYNVDFSLAYREGSQYWRNKILEIANKYKQKKFHFAIADEEEFADELNAVGLGDSGLEQNAMVFGVDGKKYPMDPEKYDGELEENLVAFLEDIGTGKVRPFVKSQPVPKEDPKKSPVRTVVASTFDKVVRDEAKDVLIEFYAPWCGHCKAFEPKFKQFAAQHAREEPNLVVAKFDATENDVPEKYPVEGFPTIYFARAGKKDEPIKYSGTRELEDLAKFVRQNAVKSFQQKRREEKQEEKQKEEEQEEASSGKEEL